MYLQRVKPYVFQSTLPRGERPRDLIILFIPLDFNPRSHEGSDILQQHTQPELRYFNPRSHEGSDILLPVVVQFLDISIHAPTRGATKGAGYRLGIDALFQSTLPRGERQQFSPKSSLFSQQKLSKIFNLNNKLF